MKVYFVRHGESKYNALGLHQTEDTPLSETGTFQARLVAKRFKKIDIDIILSSPSLRARQTSDEIKKVVKKDIIWNKLISEIKRPSEIEHKNVNDPKVLEIKKLIQSHIDDPLWHFSDEENFFDLRQRAIAFLDNLNDFSEENILVVTHGMILRMIIGVMLFDHQLTPENFIRLENFLKTNNTGITICERNSYNKWHLKTWNDIAHLGD